MGVLNKTQKCAIQKDRLSCVNCNGNIKGFAVKAGGNFWCKDHFTCAECGIRMRLPESSKENTSVFIMKDCIKALDQTWCPECFNCAKCGDGFGAGQGFHELDSPNNGKPYCRACFIDITCSKCAGCKKPITDRAVKALDSDWHVDCFVCKTCKSSFVGQSNFYCVDGEPICSKCVGS